MSKLSNAMVYPITALIVGVCCMSALSADFSTPLTDEQVNTMTTPDTQENPVFRMQTNKGEIIVRFYADKAPKTVENFRKYVQEGFYNGTIFHRVIDGFMIQGGGFTEDMTQKPTHDAIVSEASRDVHNKKGTLAMARTNYPHSATSQFFINVTDNAFLNRKSVTGEPDGYTVFGEVTKGMDVVDAIRKVPTSDKGGHQNVPVTPVVITSITEVK